MSVLGCWQGYQEMLMSREQRHWCYLGHQCLPCVRLQDTTGKGEPNSGSLLDSEVTGMPSSFLFSLVTSFLASLSPLCHHQSDISAMVTFSRNLGSCLLL